MLGETPGYYHSCLLYGSRETFVNAMFRVRMQRKQTANTVAKQLSLVLENHFLCCIFSGKDSKQ